MIIEMTAETIILSDDEAALVRTLLRVDTPYDPEAFLSGQQLTVTWDEAREVGDVLMEHMVKGMADAHESGELGHLDDVNRHTQNVYQKIMNAFRGATDD